MNYSKKWEETELGVDMDCIIEKQESMRYSLQRNKQTKKRLARFRFKSKIKNFHFATQN